MKVLNFKHILIIAVITFAFSFFLHYPLLPHKVYDDVSYFWSSRPEIHGYQVPYTDYNLEYPVISGLVLYLSSQWHNILGYYVTISLITLGFVMISIIILDKTLLITNQPRNKTIYYVLLTPVFVVYSIYSFDWIGIGLLLLSIYYCQKNKEYLSGGFMGLAIATRIIPVVCVPFILREFKSLKQKVGFLCIAFLVWLVPNVYFMLKNFGGFLYPYTFQNSWHTEDSWLVIFGSEFPERQYVSLGLLAALLVVIYSKKRFDVWQVCFLALLAFVLTSYKFPPQYMILLLPFFALIRTRYLFFIIASILDALIIILLPAFQGAGLASWEISSPVQWIAIARQAILVPVFVSVINYFKK